MNLLLVDDNKYVIEGIKKSVSFDELGINEVYCCYNSLQAREIISTYDIDLMLCDIEMPHENGLELLEWIRNEGYSIETAFITSYAKFEYAQKAIRLNSVDYLLKPVDPMKLRVILEKMIDRLLETREKEVLVDDKLYWIYNIKKNFWKDIVDDTFGEDSMKLYQRIKDDRVYQKSNRFIPILITMATKENSKWEEGLFEFACKNIFVEVLTDEGIEIETFLRSGYFQYIGMIKCEIDKGSVDNILRKFIHHAERVFGINICGYVGLKSKIDEIIGVIKTLEEIQMEHMGSHDKLIYQEDYSVQEKVYISPNIEIWLHLLNAYNKEALLQKVDEYFEHIIHTKKVNSDVLKAYRLELLQMIYTVLKSKGITPYNFMINYTDKLQYEKSIKSVELMIVYSKNVLIETIDYMTFAEKSKSVVEVIKDYVDHNLDNVTRSMIAEKIYMTPNYISKLFKKETGESLSSYIIKKRIKKAKELLINTQLSISKIAVEVGYTNFAYFSKIFKQITGITPNEYRHKKLSDS